METTPHRTTAALTPLLGHVMLDLSACLGEVDHPLTVAEIKALRPVYSDEIVRRALRALVNVGELQVVILYERRPGQTPRRYAHPGGGPKSLAPAESRPEVQISPRAASEGSLA